MALTKISTDGVKDDAITKTKIPANQIEASELADNAVDTNAIADNAVTAGKLASGVQTTINNNADNRVITGSGTANTLNAESNVVIDSSGRLLLGVSSDSSTTSMTISGNSFSSASQAQLNMDLGSTSVSDGTSLGIIRFRATGDNRGADIRGVGDGTWSAGSSHPTRLAFYTNAASSSGTPTERMRIDSSGNVIIKNTGVTASTGLLQLNHTDGRKNTIGTHYAGNAYDSRIEFGISDGSTSGGTNRVASISYAGISFGTDTASANRLDDYEDGSWTINPHDGSCTSFSTRYTKIGNTVTVWGRATGFSDTSTNDLVRLKGLPYSATTSNFATCCGPAMAQQITEDSAWVAFVEGDQIKFYGSNSGSFDQLRHNELGSGHEIYFSATYTTV